MQRTGMMAVLIGAAVFTTGWTVLPAGDPSSSAASRSELDLGLTQIYRSPAYPDGPVVWQESLSRHDAGRLAIVRAEHLPNLTPANRGWTFGSGSLDRDSSAKRSVAPAATAAD